MLNYREKLGINKNNKFGVEIEFEGPNLESVLCNLKKKNIDAELVMLHKRQGCDFSKWIIDIDTTVSHEDKKNKGIYYGGEISSKILTNKINDWKELKKVCEALKELEAKATSLCSTHINVDVSDVKDNYVFFETLFKIIILFENEIATFLMGDKYLIRDTKKEYAENVATRLSQKINFIDFKNPNFLKRMLFDKEVCMCNRDAINLSKVPVDSIIEFRYPNGTLNADTIQNNINFIISLLDAIKKNKFNIRELTMLVNQKINSPSLFKEETKDIVNESNFYRLIEIISKSLTDEIYFEDQFKNIIKSKSF